MQSRTDQDRVLVLAPTSGDAAISRSILSEAKLACLVCDLATIGSEIESGAGVVLLTQEVLTSSECIFLIEALQGQPAWSDIPVVLLCGYGADSSAAALAMEILGNVTVLERPVRVSTLVSALRTAIRARHRQYQIRDQLEDLTLAEGSLRRQTERLRLLWETASVLLMSEEPDVMMRELFTRIAPHFGLDAYFNLVMEKRTDVLRLESSTGLTAAQKNAITHLPAASSICGAAARARQPMAYSNIQATVDPLLVGVKDWGFRSFACTPMLADDRVLGVLTFASRQKDKFDVEEIEFLETITRYVTVAYERVRLIDQLRDTDRRKDEFLATLAHELRNPLAPIRNALQIMRLTEGDAAVAEKARAMMDRQLGQMVRLIDDLLDVSRITRGKLALRKERVELSTIVKNAVDTAMPLIASAGHELTVDLVPYPLYLDADPVRLAQVFANLLNNAAKYTERGGHLWLAAGHHDSHVTVSVRDSGIGIPAEALPHIFEMFTQVDRSLEKSQGGLGIGLTLVKRLVEMHGGNVQARSGGVGRGSEFEIKLPVAAAAPMPVRGEEPALPSRDNCCRILVADDNRDAAESMGTMLRLMGNDVRTVHDGAQAVEVAAAFLPDVVLLDIGMPHLNGYEAARRIRREQWGRNMHLVALTGWGQHEDKLRAAEAGFDRHFTKPVDPADLERIVAGLRSINARALAPPAEA